MKRVIIESPFAGDVDGNLAFLRRAILDCLHRGEAPFASHGFYPQVLDDTLPSERYLGMEAGHAWLPVASLVVVYTDRGISMGMQQGIRRAEACGIPVEYRTLDK